MAISGCMNSTFGLSACDKIALKRAERVAQASALGSQLKLQCLLVTTGDVIGGHYSRDNAR